MSATAIILGLAKRPWGVSNSEAQEAAGKGPEYVSGCIGRLTQHCRLVQAKSPGNRDRWFIFPEHAAEWLLTAPPPKPPKPKPEPRPKAAPKPPKIKVIKARPSMPATVYIVPRPFQGPTLIPATVIKSYGLASGFDPRYQCSPGEQAFGAGFAAVGIGRDVDTGTEWAQR